MSELLNKLHFRYIVFRGKRYTQKTVEDAIDHLAAYLDKNNHSSSPFILISMYNHIKSIIAYYAVLKAGKIAVVLDPGCKSIELSEIIEDVDPGVILFINADSISFNYEEEIIFRKSRPGFIIGSDLKDVCTIAYTNAEDGYSKGAMLTEQNLMAEIHALLESSKITANSVVCALIPYAHSFGFAEGVLVPTHIGATAIVEEMNLIRITAIMQNIREHGVTHFYTVPSVYYILSKIPEIEHYVKNIEGIYSGGTHLSGFIHDNFYKKTNRLIREGYGLTESSPAVAIDDIEASPVLNSIGKALNGVEIRILDVDGKECLPDQVGEICIKGDMVFKGYFNSSDTTKKVLDNEWLHTGDLGKKDLRGFIYYIGLKKKMINVAGNNVYPRKLERIMKIHKNVKEVLIFSEDSLLQGQIVCAKVKLLDSSLKAQELFKKWCLENINNTMLPKQWQFE